MDQILNSQCLKMDEFKSLLYSLVLPFFVIVLGAAITSHMKTANSIL